MLRRPLKTPLAELSILPPREPTGGGLHAAQHHRGVVRRHLTTSGHGDAADRPRRAVTRCWLERRTALALSVAVIFDPLRRPHLLPRHLRTPAESLCCRRTAILTM